MRCSEAQEQLVAAHDGELGPSAVAQLESHLAHCARCRAWDERLRSLSVGEPLAVPSHVQRRLEATTDSLRIVQQANARRRRFTPVLAAAALVAVSVAGLSLTGGGGDDPAAPSAAAPIPSGQFRPAAFQPDEKPDVSIYDTNTLHLPAPPTDEGR